ncbi:MAG: MBL fold metallo-hydrolase [Thermoclostridium sp.]|nr:MBL fold metallo-hydrolase [Thermoclostridium sp.]
MQITIYRGTHEIGGTLVELKSGKSRILIDAGYPLFLNNQPIEDEVSSCSHERLLELGVLPDIKGLYGWDTPAFDAVIISHAHIDHYGLLHYIHPAIPVYLSKGTRKIIEISALFMLSAQPPTETREFTMYKPFQIGDFRIMPFLMDHSAFDAAAFEISDNEKTIIYTGDFRGHGRKAVCLDLFINNAKKSADALLTEGTMFGRQDEEVMTEQELEDRLVKKIEGFIGPVLFQSSSQNIDRLVSFYRAASRLDKVFVVDVYTANVLYELRQLGNNHLPYPSRDYPNIKVFYPYRLTQKIFNKIGEEYAKRFSPFYIPKDVLKEKQNNIVMAVRPSMRMDIKIAGLQNGLFVYSLWSGYRDSEYQKEFENFLDNSGFTADVLHTSGHATVSDIRRVITELEAKQIIPIHTMVPAAFIGLSENVILKEDGKAFNI